MSHQRLLVDSPMATSFWWHMGGLIVKGIGHVAVEVWKAVSR